MKSLLPALLALFLPAFAPANAATVESVRIEGSEVRVTVKYSGCSSRHRFTLRGAGCYQTYPQSCSIEVIDQTRERRCSQSVPQTQELRWDLEEILALFERQGGQSILDQGDSVTFSGAAADERARWAGLSERDRSCLLYGRTLEASTYQGVTLNERRRCQ